MSERAEDREQMMKRHLIARGIRDDRLLEAFRSVPRDAFLPSSRSRPRDRSGRAGSPRAGAGRRAPLGPRIRDFWREPAPRQTAIWREHEDIDDVMLAACLVPSGVILLSQEP